MPSFNQIKNNQKVQYLGQLTEGGYEVELIKGLSFDPMTDSRVRFEDTLSDIQKTIKEAVEFAGPYED